MTLKVAPYGKPLAELIANNKAPSNSIYVFMGKKSWSRAKKSVYMRPTRTLCLPPFDSPFDYVWPVVGCDVLIFDTYLTDEDSVHDLVAVLYKYDALIVRYVSVECKLTVFKRN